ncbi:MAG TPA: TraR/DksA C4-type zinc finger protein [Cellulomonas sp.]
MDEPDRIDPVEAAEALRVRRADAVARLAGTGAERAAVVSAARESVTDDEHDPEGATIAYERRMLDVLSAGAEQRIAEVDAALERLAGGVYQVCAVCGGPIAADRLQALPTARTCVACGRRG